jgi:SAM-dependent methyltransferase
LVSAISPRRLWNATRKLIAGLPLGGEAVWPGLRNDLFVAHASIYGFAATRAPHCRTLDAACGTGYGSHLLAQAGAESVLGIDRNSRRVRFAARRFVHPALRFRVGDCERLSFPADSFDLVVSSNTLEHLGQPARFLRSIARALSPRGQLIVAVPPVLSEADRRANASNPDHVSNLSVRGWGELFEKEGWAVSFISHRCARPLDFGSYRTSSVRTEDFVFLEEGIDAAYQAGPITAIYELRRQC